MSFLKHFDFLFHFGVFIFPACPSAPKDFKVSEVTRHHVHLMWEVPEHDGGSPVTHYQIEKREVSRKTWAKVYQRVDLFLKTLIDSAADILSADFTGLNHVQQNTK